MNLLAESTCLRLSYGVKFSLYYRVLYELWRNWCFGILRHGLAMAQIVGEILTTINFRTIITFVLKQAEGDMMCLHAAQTQ
jgi:hypothetical protein